MMTVKQVSLRTGVSIRTLQFYDEIGLLKPTATTNAGYRLYDNHALEVLQQILFFKELDFPLKEIKTIMENPQFDPIAGFQKQRELIRMKRDRLNALLDLLDKLIKGDACMSFQEFDMSEYTNALEEFIASHGDELLQSGGDPEEFRQVLAVLKSDSPRKIELAKLAIKQYGSIERYTAAMKDSMEHFPELMQKMDLIKEQADDLMDQSNQLMKLLTSDLSRAVTSSEVQEIVEKMVCLTNETNPGVDMGAHYWSFMADYYESNANVIQVMDEKYGAGASKYIALALKAYLDRQ